MIRVEQVLRLDARVSASLSIPSSERWLRLLAQVFAHSGDSLLWLAGAVAVLIWADHPWKPVGWGVIAAILLTGTLTALLKRAFRRLRPPNQTQGLYLGPDHYAFPSGHAARTACLAALLSPFLSPGVAALLYAWAFSVGLARVALRIHFASDIVAGWVVGFASALLLGALSALLWPLGAR